MAWSDDWGNKYPTYDDAVEGIHKILKARDDYFEILSKGLGIDLDLLEFIYRHNCGKAFEAEYAKQIKAAEDDWCECYIWDLEEFE